jgi:tannase/feruloyl esterase
VALEQWIDKGTPPSTVIASKFAGEGAARRTTMTRPLCAYPQDAHYAGKGDTNDAANFACGPPGR